MSKHKNLQKRSLSVLIIIGTLAVLFALLSVYGLMNNSKGAKQRYDALIAVDQAGGDVDTALNELRSYIYSHMNTQIGSELGIRPPIQLKGTYERLVAAEEAKVAKVNESIYAAAQTYCEQNNPAGSLRNGRVQCVESYLDENSVKPATVEDDFYKFDFVPPRWSADLAGISMLFAGLFGTIFIIKLIYYFKTKSMVQI